MKELEVGQIRKGIVKNIADFGAFVDLGGIDGLLHITDMAWERIGHPSEMVTIDQEIEVKVLHIDREKQKIALGLKQKDRNPWDNIENKYPVESVHKGEVVNVMSYGAFVKLEPGIEGLVHISEMSWTKRVNHPSELVNIGDKIEVKILASTPKANSCLGYEANSAKSLGRSGGTLSRRFRRGQRQGSQPDQLRCVCRVGRRHRWFAARQRHVVDAQDQPPQRNAREGPRESNAACCRRSNHVAASRWV
jgi:predicted RNA-binding protein with RPS1 domain